METYGKHRQDYGDLDLHGTHRRKQYYSVKITAIRVEDVLVMRVGLSVSW